MKLMQPAIATMARALLLALSCLSSSVTLAQTFEVTVDTSSLAGTSGFVDFQFNPADTSAPAATAGILDWLGDLSLLGAPSIEGSVIGNLPGALQLVNDTPFNDYFQSVQFGQSFSFTLDFTGAFASTPSLLGTSFALSLYAVDAITPLLSIDDTGSLVRFDLASNGITFQTFPPDLSTAPVTQVSPVPLPAAVWLLLSAMAGLFGVRRRHSG